MDVPDTPQESLVQGQVYTAVNDCLSSEVIAVLPHGHDHKEFTSQWTLNSNRVCTTQEKYPDILVANNDYTGCDGVSSNLILLLVSYLCNHPIDMRLCTAET